VYNRSAGVIVVGKGAGMSIDAESFKQVMACWPSGVTVVTTATGEAWHGMTASSFSSVSLEPPLVSICIAKHVTSHDLIAASGIFAVNILARGQVDLGKRFAGMIPGVVDRFEGIDCATATTGSPLLVDALGWVDCAVERRVDGGDHTIFVGRVLAAGVGDAAPPLLYHSRSWGQVADLLPETASITDLTLAVPQVVALDDPRWASVACGLVAAGVRDLRLADLELADGDLLRRSALVRELGVRLSGGVRGRGGIARAAAAELDGVDIDLVPGASDMSVLIAEARDRDLEVRVGIAGALGRRGQPAPEIDEVVAAVADAVTAGADEVVLIDGAGTASPLLVREVLLASITVAAGVPIAVRLQDAWGMGMASLLVAAKSGVHRFETSLGGVGGVSPAAGLPGAIATEDAVHLLDLLGIATGADRTELARAARALADDLRTELPGKLHRGLPAEEIAIEPAPAGAAPTL
jgi:flavin reductase (DIM6/NTAB) family NADH-FMN oxidoreductase RutF